MQKNLSYHCSPRQAPVFRRKLINIENNIDFRQAVTENTHVDQNCQKVITTLVFKSMAYFSQKID
jgi:hypothetical protein